MRVLTVLRHWVTKHPEVGRQRTDFVRIYTESEIWRDLSWFILILGV